MANKKRKCKYCGNPLGETAMKTPVGIFCAYDCAIKYAQDKQAKDRERNKRKIVNDKAKLDKADRKRLRELKSNDRRHQFLLTKTVIQKWVHKVRDAGMPCISCGTCNPNIVYSGGHYRTAGGNPEIALESKNIHRQCLFNCNKNKSGNISGDKHSIGFKQGLINRYGVEYVEWLESYHESPRLDCEQLIELRSYYNRLIREGIKNDDDRPFF